MIMATMMVSTGWITFSHDTNDNHYTKIYNVYDPMNIEPGSLNLDLTAYDGGTPVATYPCGSSILKDIAYSKTQKEYVDAMLKGVVTHLSIKNPDFAQYIEQFTMPVQDEINEYVQ